MNPPIITPGESIDDVSVAVIRNDIKYMREDLSEIKAEFRDFKAFYVTKEDHLKDLNALDNRLKAIEETKQFYFRTVMSAALAAVIGLIVTVMSVQR